MKKPSIIILLASILMFNSCQSGGGRVMPSLSGNAALIAACNAMPADIIPNIAYQSDGFFDKSQNGSAGMVFGRFLEGFEYIDANITQAQINEGNAISPPNATIWGIKPLSNIVGISRMKILPFGHENCKNFEKILDEQGDINAMNFWNDSRFAQNIGRNWCIGNENDPVKSEYAYNSIENSEQTGTSYLHSKIETLSKNDIIIARRTLIWLSQPLFPIATSSTNIGCNLKTFGPQSDFVGTNGIALKPAQSPSLIKINN